MGKSPLKEWQDREGLDDHTAAFRTGLKLSRWLDIRDGAAVLTDDEAEKLRAATGIADIAEQYRRYALSRVPKAPPVVPPKP